MTTPLITKARALSIQKWVDDDEDPIDPDTIWHLCATVIQLHDRIEEVRKMLADTQLDQSADMKPVLRSCDECGGPWTYEPNEAGEQRPVVYHSSDCPHAGSSGRNKTIDEKGTSA